MALQTEFHELVALAFSVVDWEVCLCLTVGGADDVCGFVDAALKLACFGQSLNFQVKVQWIYLCTHLGVDLGRLGLCLGYSPSLHRHCRYSRTKQKS